MKHPREILIAGTFVSSWLGMQLVHEMGHVLAAWISGGAVKRVVLAPWSLSRTDLSLNPHPAFVTWGGPILGVVVPVLAWNLAEWMRWRPAFVVRFFAGFCAIANGVYIGFGSFEGLGDAGDLIRAGSPLWSLWLFGAVTVPLGFLLWNRQGSRFGLGAKPEPASPTIAWGTCAFAMALLILGTVVGGG